MLPMPKKNITIPPPRSTTRTAARQLQASPVVPAPLVSNMKIDSDSDDNDNNDRRSNTSSPNSLTCPMCNRTVPLKAHDDPDTVMAIHVDRCSRRSSSRSTRGGDINYRNIEEALDNLEDDYLYNQYQHVRNDPNIQNVIEIYHGGWRNIIM